MKIDELNNHFGNWSQMMRFLGLGHNTYQSWRKLGYIPYQAQCLIEKKTNGLFTASEAHGRPPYKRRGTINSEQAVK